MIADEKENPLKSSTKAAHIQGLGKYIVAPENEKGVEKCVYHGAYGFLTDSPEAQRAEMIALASECVRSRDPIAHWVLSWHSDERPTRGQVDEAVTIFMDEMGLNGHQVIYGLHDDTKNMHVHMMINRTHPETFRAIDAGGGWKVKASLRACARIEHAQGWGPELRALYEVVEQVDEHGERVAKVVERGQADRSRNPRGVKRDREIRYGEQSAERIAITDAAPLIKAAKTWKELHQALAAIGMRYERKGSGALVYVGDVPIKASNVDRAASLGAMQKRLGPYESSSQEKPNEYFSHKAKPHSRHLGVVPGNGLRQLSQCRMAPVEVDKENARVLSLDARAGRRSSDRVRRDSDRGRTGGGTGRVARPLAAGQPAWAEYIEIRDARKVQKRTETNALKQRQQDEQTALYARLKAERAAALLASDWRGNGMARNALASVIATKQASEKLAQRGRHAAERKALRDQFAPMPPYKEWKLAPAITGKVTGKIVIEDEAEIRALIAADQASKLAEMLRHLEKERTRHGLLYRSRGVEFFRDEGRRLAVLNPRSDEAIAVALAVAQERFGRTLTLTGDQAFQRRVVAVAVANNLPVRFTDPTLEALRLETKEARVRRRSEKPATAREKWDEARRTIAAKQPADRAPPDRAPVAAPAAPERMLEVEPKIDPITAWLAAHPERQVRTPALLPASGRVLAVAEDGRMLLNVGRAVAVYPAPTGFTPQVDDLLDIDKHSQAIRRGNVPGKGKGQ